MVAEGGEVLAVAVADEGHEEMVGGAGAELAGEIGDAEGAVG